MTISCTRLDTAAGDIGTTGRSLQIKAAAVGTGMLGGGGTAISIDYAATTHDYSALGTTTWGASKNCTWGATSVLDFGANKLTNIADPLAATDAASKSYVDSVASGLDVKKSCMLATTEDILGTDLTSPVYANTGGASSLGQITATLDVTNVWTVDGVALSATDNGERILLKDEADAGGLTGDANGIYTITISGTSLTLDRATDFDSDAEVTSGAFTFINEGTTNQNTGWVLSTDDPIVLGGASGTDLVFTQFSGAGLITAGQGLTKNGNTLNVGDGNKGIQVNADNLELDASEVVGDGMMVGAFSHLLKVKADVTSTGNVVQAINVGVNGVGVKVDNLTIDTDGSDQLQVKANSINLSHIKARPAIEINTVSGSQTVFDMAASTYDANFVDAVVADVDGILSRKVASPGATVEEYSVTDFGGAIRVTFGASPSDTAKVSVRYWKAG